MIAAPEDTPSELDDELAEYTGTSNSMLMVTSVAGHDKVVSSAVASMSATAAGKTERRRVKGFEQARGQGDKYGSHAS